VSETGKKIDPEIWTMSLIGDVFGFIDHAFCDLDVEQRDALRTYLEASDIGEGLYKGVKDRLLECIWESKTSQYNPSSSTH
jgi:hypothetical protein